MHFHVYNSNYVYMCTMQHVHDCLLGFCGCSGFLSFLPLRLPKLYSVLYTCTFMYMYVQLQCRHYMYMYKLHGVHKHLYMYTVHVYCYCGCLMSMYFLWWFLGHCGCLDISKLLRLVHVHCIYMYIGLQGLLGVCTLGLSLSVSLLFS